MSITRRELLRRAGMLGAASLIPTFTACTDDGGSEGDGETGGTGETGETGGGDDLPIYEWDGDPGPASVFSHGVASGDPLADSVILWTRVTPDDAAAELFFEVARDPEFSDRVAADWLGVPDEGRDYTFKLDLDGLEAASTYYYRFWIQGVSSPIGRTRTAPDGASEHLRFVVCSCSSLAHGYFHNYRHIGGRADIDAVLHLGDYIYEYASGDYGDIREYEPAHEIVTLSDYRARHGQYKSDPDLQAAHRQHPFITTWDDHEIANDGWFGGAENHDPDAGEGDWEERKAVAKQAYFEWLPVREGVPGRIYRHLAYGDLVDLIVLDTRYEGREQQVQISLPGSLDLINDPDRQLLGLEQEAWLLERLSTSTAQWKLIAQQVMMGQVIITPGADGAPNRPFISDPWDGYEAARRTVYAHISDNGISDVVVLTGDIHTSWAHELTVNPLDGYDPATSEGAVAVEFVTPGITSPGLPIDQGTLDLLLPNNPHIKYTEFFNRGYMTIDVKPERVHCDWWYLNAAQIESPDPSTPSHGKALAVETAVPRLIEGSGPAAEKADPPPLAP